MTVTLLAAADLHLGRPIHRVPDALRGAGVDPTAAWEALVELAAERRPAALLLAGDVVDEENRFFEALAPLERGVRRLVDAGVPVIAVAGNHDADVLPRLASAIDGFTLLGAGGGWESRRIEAGGRAAVEIVGWSFPQREVRDSPLPTLPPPPPDGVPRIGLLHGDVDVPDSPYAPLASAALDAAPVAAWLLGHVHVPSRDGLAAPRPIGYLGSLVGLDPTETGPHGAWTITVDAGRVHCAPEPLATLRWETATIELDEATADAVQRSLTRGIRALHERLRADLGRARTVGVRLRVEGAVARPDAVDAPLGEAVGEAIPCDDVTYFVDRAVNATRPAVDLEAMARENDPAARLARMLLLLERDDDDADRRELVRRAAAELADVHEALTTSSDDVLTEADVAERLQRSGRRALAALLATREEAAHAP